MSKTGAPRKAPLNLNALRAQQTDARGEKYLEFELTPEGEAEKPETFKVLRRNWWPVKLVEHSNDIALMRQLMGDEDFERLLDAGLEIRDLQAVFAEAFGSEEDISLGESAGSSES